MIVYAKLDGDAEPRWWEYFADNHWLERDALNENAPRRMRPAHMLEPVRADWHVYVGDARGVAEIWRAREAKSKAASEPNREGE